MTALQMNAELFRNMSIVAEDETLMEQLVKFLRKLVAKKKDETLMTKEEFFAEVDEALEQAKRGEVYEWLPGENFETFIARTKCTK